MFSPFFILWFAVGIFFFQCKVFAIGSIYNFWFYLYTGTQQHDIDTLVDTSLLNEALLVHIIESMPQLVIQILNSTYIEAWTPISLFSTFLSAFITINGLYRFVYYLIWRGIHIDVSVEQIVE